MSQLGKLSALLVIICVSVTGCSKGNKQGKQSMRGANIAPRTADDQAAAQKTAAGEATPEVETESVVRLGDDEQKTVATQTTATGTKAKAATTQQIVTEEDGSGEEEEQPEETEQPEQAEQSDVPVKSKATRNQPTQVDTREGNRNRNRECGTAYRAKTAEWYPGLPFPPNRTPICTGVDRKGQDISMCGYGQTALYTDSKTDGLMAEAVYKVNQLSQNLQSRSREFAKNVTNFSLSRSSLRLKILRGEGERSYTLTGSRTKMRTRGGQFVATVKCSDASGGCQNALIRIEEKRQGETRHVLYVVHRWGDAHITISEQDRLDYKTFANGGHGRLAQYLSNTVNNSCVSTLNSIRRGKRQMDRCAQERLMKICGDGEWKRPAAAVFDFRSWAVAYGPAFFEVGMYDNGRPGVFDYNSMGSPRLLIAGPLMIRGQTPMNSKPLYVSGSLGKYVDSANLMNNDGGGNLNIELEFKGDGERRSRTRVSVTTLLADTESQGVEQDQPVEQGELPPK